LSHLEKRGKGARKRKMKRGKEEGTGRSGKRISKTFHQFKRGNE